MSESRLHLSSQGSEAEWIAPRLREFASGVAAIVPDGFPGYVRILHPACGSYHTKMRWAEVAARSGRTMHRLVQFHAINRPPISILGYPVNPPNCGNLPADLFAILRAALAKHTSTPDACYFCVWEGCGWIEDPDLPQALRDAVPKGPVVHFPQRNYYLFEGSLEAAAEIGWKVGHRFISQSPNLCWPHDRAWCVASELDLFCTLVGGSDALVEELAGDQRLEAWRVFSHDPMTADSDHVNTDP